MDAPPTDGHGHLDRLPLELHEPAPITERTLTPYWTGEPMDLGYVVSFLFPPEQSRDTVADLAKAG